MPLVLSGDGSVGPLSATEMGYLDGVTSAVQTQINSKLTTPGAWTSWTPAFSGTVGNGSLTGAYTQIGKTVHYQFHYVLGSTSTFPMYATFGLPVTPTGPDGVIGHATMIDDNLSLYWLGGHLAHTKSIVNPNDRSYQGYCGGTVPFTWTTNDRISVYGTYQAA